jgi:hypothetical protein
VTSAGERRQRYRPRLLRRDSDEEVIITDTTVSSWGRTCNPDHVVACMEQVVDSRRQAYQGCQPPRYRPLLRKCGPGLRPGKVAEEQAAELGPGDRRALGGRGG